MILEFSIIHLKNRQQPVAPVRVLVRLVAPGAAVALGIVPPSAGATQGVAQVADTTFKFRIHIITWNIHHSKRMR
jgi:hypothetical protein